MATATTTRTTLSDDQLLEILSLMKNSDSVELKLTIPETDHYSTLGALGIDALDAQIRQVFFFDTPDLTLNKNGVVVRARRIQQKGGDSTVKLRPVVPAELPKDLRNSANFKVEVDAMPGGFVCSGSMREKADAAVIREAAKGNQGLRSLFSKEQRAFFSSRCPEGITLDDLEVLGPIFVLKTKFMLEGAQRSMAAELWLYPDNSRVLELSTKCAPAEAFQVAAETRAYLSSKGIDLSGEQQTKTGKALKFFSSRLQESKEKLA
jgi:hypothetical protein